MLQLQPPQLLSRVCSEPSCAQLCVLSCVQLVLATRGLHLHLQRWVKSSRRPLKGLGTPISTLTG